MSETPEQRNERFAKNRATVLAEIKRLNPDAEATETKFIYYTVSVIQSKIVVEKNERNIYGNDTVNILKDKYLTEKDAKDAILKVLPDAKAKYEACLSAYVKLRQDMGFSIGNSYDGDTYGIYNEYEYIYFKMDGFSFEFEIN